MRSETCHIVISGLLLMTASFAMAQSSTITAGNVLKGKAIYDARCSACHSVDDNRVGPMHMGVFGRKAGGVKTYPYSEALRKSKVVWSRDTLTAWLANPEILIPGQLMGYAMDNVQDREDVVAYLATLKVIK